MAPQRQPLLGREMFEPVKVPAFLTGSNAHPPRRRFSVARTLETDSGFNIQTCDRLQADMLASSREWIAAKLWMFVCVALSVVHTSKLFLRRCSVKSRL